MVEKTTTTKLEEINKYAADNAKENNNLYNPLTELQGKMNQFMGSFQQHPDYNNFHQNYQQQRKQPPAYHYYQN